MRRVLFPLALLVCSVVLGATVFREQVAWAAQVLDTRITNVDAKGNIKVHEQGIARVTTSDDPARSPWVDLSGEAFLDGDDVADIRISTPAGKRLVLEAVNASGWLTDEESRVHWMKLYAVVNGETHVYRFKSENLGPIERYPGDPDKFQEFVSGTSATRIYVDGGTTIKLVLLRSSGNGLGRVEVQLSGYSIDCTVAPCG